MSLGRGGTMGKPSQIPDQQCSIASGIGDGTINSAIENVRA